MGFVVKPVYRGIGRPLSIVCEAHIVDMVATVGEASGSASGVIYHI